MMPWLIPPLLRASTINIKHYVFMILFSCGHRFPSGPNEWNEQQLNNSNRLHKIAWGRPDNLVIRLGWCHSSHTTLMLITSHSVFFFAYSVVSPFAFPAGVRTVAVITHALETELCDGTVKIRVQNRYNDNKQSKYKKKSQLIVHPDR